MKNAEYWIDKLQLKPHPEGGFFREVYRSEDKIIHGLPDRYKSGRNFSTSIYFLLKSDLYSAFHKIQSDEIWHFYAGSSVLLHVITPEGKLIQQSVGANDENGDVFQYFIPNNCWFAAEVTEENSYALVGCTVAPGFDFDDFELGYRVDLIKEFPMHEELITKFTS